MTALRAALAFFVLAACATAAPPADAGPADDLARLAQDYRARQLAEDPILAGQEGDREAAKRLPDVSPDALARQKAALETLRSRAEAIPAAPLTDTDKATRGLLIHEIDSALVGYRFDEARIPFSNDSGFHTLLDYLARATPIRTVEDADALLARYRDFRRYAQQNIANMRRGMADGFTQPKLVVDRVIETLEAQQVTGDPRAYPLYEPFADLPESWSAADRQRITDHAQKAVVADLAPAFDEVLRFFRDEYRPAARDTIGAAALPGGAAYYAARVRSYTTLDLTPEEIHAIGVSEVDRIRAEMQAIIAEVGFEGTFAEFLEFLRTDPRFYAETPEELLKDAAWIAKRIDGRLPEFFGVLPRLPYGVMPVPDAMAPAYTTGRYWPGDPKNGVAGNYVVNTYALKERPLYELAALTLHEAVPGHHLQIALAQEMTDLPAFRTDAYVTAFGEGWGLYAESLGEEMGIYATPYERFGKLSYEMWRACRLVVDTGLHAMGWTREHAEACFLENSALSRGNITTEVDRYIAWPGQALAYKMGELKIKELRARAEGVLGDKFDVRAFHDAVLEDGSVTLEMLDAKIDRRIAAQ